MRFGSLFAGIGGFDIGLERAGMTCAWQVEIDDYARRVLEKHWPNVRRWDDVRTFPPGDGFSVDLICGGFPCQDISDAGGKAGIDGVRSGLWSEFNRIVRLLRPRYVVVENVAALLRRGMGRVLGDLAACGYDCEWDCLAASDFGAPHIRERIFIIGYPRGFAWKGRDAGRKQGQERPQARHTIGSSNANGHGKLQLQGSIADEWRRTCDGTQWATEPRVGRVAYGVSAGVDRLKGIGNAVVPQVAEWIARRIMETQQQGT